MAFWGNSTTTRRRPEEPKNLHGGMCGQKPFSKNPGIPALWQGVLLLVGNACWNGTVGTDWDSGEGTGLGVSDQYGIG